MTTESQPHFDPSLISPKHNLSLPPTLRLRPLSSSGFFAGHLNVLSVLTHVGSITEAMWNERFEEMVGCKGTYFIAVIVEKQTPEKIIGTGTLVVERKFLNTLGKQGHIEDIAIASEYQGKGLGTKIIEVLGSIAEQVGCYKTILDCREEKEGFYLKCGYERRGLEMHRYCDDEVSAAARGYSV